MCPVCMTTAALIAACSTSGAGVLGIVGLKSRRRVTSVLKPPAVEAAAQPAAAAGRKLVATGDGYEQRLLSELGKWCRENGRTDLATVFDEAQILERYEHG